jgi:hypothetical protein
MQADVICSSQASQYSIFCIFDWLWQMTGLRPDFRSGLLVVQKTLGQRHSSEKWTVVQDCIRGVSNPQPQTQEK